MPKIVAALGLPAVLGGAGLLYDGAGAPRQVPADPLAGGYMVAVGVAFPEAAVRAALPPGLEPAPGFTGGIALYGGEEGWALSPLATGYLWLDLAGADGTPARFLIQGFTTEGQGAAGPLSAGETHELGPDGRLSVTARPDAASLLGLDVRVDAASCREGLSAAGGPVLVRGGGESYGVVHMPVVLDRCEAEALSARIEAPQGHPMGGLRPEAVLWAGVGSPLRWAMPEL